MLSRSSSTKIQYIHKTEISAPATSRWLAESARTKALPRALLYHLRFFSCLYTYYYTHYQHTIIIAGFPRPLVPTGETGKEFHMSFARARCRMIFFLLFYSYVNFNIFLFSSPKYRYHLLFSFSSHFSSIFSSSILTLPLTSFLSFPAKFARSADGER